MELTEQTVQHKGSEILQSFRHIFQPRVGKLDSIAYGLVMVFFVVMAWVLNGQVWQSALGALKIIVLMFLISRSIDILLAVVKNFGKIGQLMGYITNGPETVIVVVGLVQHKLTFGVGAPLGSNFANPILLGIAGLIAGRFKRIFKKGDRKVLWSYLATAILAGLFYFIRQYSAIWLWGWLVVTLIISIFLFGNRLQEPARNQKQTACPPLYGVPALAVLVAAGYFLDTVSENTAKASGLSIGLLSFIALSFLSSWPEFRSTLSMFRQEEDPSALNNILVSDITNLWLVIAGSTIYLLFLSG